jgi:hypothetical protein
MAASTAIAFATVLGAVACVDGGSSQGLVFRWRWLALLWMAFGALAGWFLWQAVWAADTVGTPRVRRRLMIYLVLLGIGGVAVFVFPITFVPPGQFRDVLTGLIAAVAVLTFVGWMIFHLGRLFSADGAGDRAGKRADPKSPDRP